MRLWTEGELATVGRMRARLATYAVIARQLGRTAVAVRQAVRRNLRVVTDAIVGELVSSGYTDREIGRLTGTSERAVRRRRNRLRLAANRKRRVWTAAELATVKRILAGGGSLWNAARAVGRTGYAVRDALLRHTTEER